MLKYDAINLGEIDFQLGHQFLLRLRVLLRLKEKYKLVVLLDNSKKIVSHRELSHPLDENITDDPLFVTLYKRYKDKLRSIKETKRKRGPPQRISSTPDYYVGEEGCYDCHE